MCVGIPRSEETEKNGQLRNHSKTGLYADKQGNQMYMTRFDGDGLAGRASRKMIDDQVSKGNLTSVSKDAPYIPTDSPSPTESSPVNANTSGASERRKAIRRGIASTIKTSARGILNNNSGKSKLGQ